MAVGSCDWVGCAGRGDGGSCFRWGRERGIKKKIKKDYLNEVVAKIELLMFGEL